MTPIFLFFLYCYEQYSLRYPTDLFLLCCSNAIFTSWPAAGLYVSLQWTSWPHLLSVKQSVLCPSLINHLPGFISTITSCGNPLLHFQTFNFLTLTFTYTVILHIHICLVIILLFENSFLGPYLSLQILNAHLCLSSWKIHLWCVSHCVPSEEM